MAVLCSAAWRSGPSHASATAAVARSDEPP